MTKKILITLSNPPHENIKNAEIIDILLSASVFDFQASILFLKTGVFNLVKNKTGLLKSLELLDIAKPVVTENTLLKYKLTSTDFLCDVTLLEDNLLPAFYAQHDYIIQG